MGDMRYSTRTNRDPVHVQAESLSFGVYSSDEVRELSTVHVTNPVAFNQLGHPLEAGLYDLRMGPFSDRDNMTCTTCHLNSEHCPGHIGHIDLPLPVVNSLFYSVILRKVYQKTIEMFSMQLLWYFVSHYFQLIPDSRCLIQNGLLNFSSQDA